MLFKLDTKLSFALGLACLLSIIQLSSANVAQSSYQIKGRPVENFMDVLVQLRRFLSSRLSGEQRCKRQAVALSTFKRGPINQFEVADIALARNEDIDRRYNQINIELLRNLYIDATRNYLEIKYVDNSLLDLLDCLKGGFRNRDARARSFLNNEELGTVVDQYNTLAKQPLRLLVDANAPQSNLQMYDYNDAIKATVGNWVGNDETKFNRFFQVPAMPTVPTVTIAPQVEEHSEPAYYEPEPRMEQQGAMAYAEAHAGQPMQMENDEQEYLDTLFGSLIALYESLPLTAQLGDRCPAYYMLIDAQKEDLFQDNFLGEVVEMVTSHLEQQGPQKSFFMPDKETRDDFLYILNKFDPLRGGAEVWLDLNGCIAKWTAEDEDVVQYMNSPARLSIIQALESQVEDETPAEAPAH